MVNINLGYFSHLFGSTVFPELRQSFNLHKIGVALYLSKLYETKENDVKKWAHALKTLNTNVECKFKHPNFSINEEFGNKFLFLISAFNHLVIWQRQTAGNPV